jgi:hypothetical protein
VRARMAAAPMRGLRLASPTPPPIPYVRMIPSLAADPPQPRPLPQIPSWQPDTSQWSAYVAPDLAPIFSEGPWLFQEPSPDAQASVLARLTSIKPTAFDAAGLRLLSPAVLTDLPAPAPARGPRSFLLAVTHRGSVSRRIVRAQRCSIRLLICSTTG